MSKREERIVTMIDNHIAEYYPQRKLIRCKDCKKWKRNDGTFSDFDGKEWHGCEALDKYRHEYTSEKPVTPACFYCGYAKRREEE